MSNNESDFNKDTVDPVDARKLRGLAHPLRLRILGRLRSDGPSTATRLADQLGESSGSTSYHLRQLASYGFVVPDEEHDGKGKERWWRSASRFTDIPRAQVREGHEGAEGYLRALAVDFSREIVDFVDKVDLVPPEWDEGWTLSDRFLRLTPDEAHQLRVDLRDVIERFRQDAAEEDPETADSVRTVLVQVQVLPRVGA
jgi:DNA-binding transcriptional ArsR family regulator